MPRRPRRSSAQRLRQATRAALRRDLASRGPGPRERDWRKPLVVDADGGWPLWIDRSAAVIGVGLFFGLHLEAPGLALLWIPPIARKFARRPMIELSRRGIRMLRTRPHRRIPWSRVGRVGESPAGLTFEELRDGAAAVRHTCPGVSSAQRFRAVSIIRAQTAANVFA